MRYLDPEVVLFVADEESEVAMRARLQGALGGIVMNAAYVEYRTHRLYAAFFRGSESHLGRRPFGPIVETDRS